MIFQDCLVKIESLLFSNNRELASSADNKTTYCFSKSSYDVVKKLKIRL